jgi:hypothetical protein
VLGVCGLCVDPKGRQVRYIPGGLAVQALNQAAMLVGTTGKSMSVIATSLT